LNVTDPRWLKRRAQRTGYQDIEDIEPITVAAYIETLQRRAAPPTVNQHMAAIRMMFSWLTEKGVLAMNPAREVKTERFSRTEGKTPAFVDGEVQRLLGAIETSTHTGPPRLRSARGPCERAERLSVFLRKERWDRARVHSRVK
jgi:site-specific recombinase XerD